MIFDGEAFFRAFNIKYNTRSKNASRGWYSLRCPFHDDHADHMGFNPSSGAFSCWRCGKKGPIDFIRASLGISRSESSVLYSKYLVNGTRTGSFTSRNQASATNIELPGKEFTPTELHYMERRAITKEHQELFDIRSGGYTDPWAYRIVLPIKVNGTIVSATGRAINKDMDPKYWTLPMDKEVIHHKHTFFNIDSVDDTAVVVEGPIDALKGGEGFIASFGVNLTDEQMCLLLKFPNVIFLQDSDEAGDKFKDQAYRLSSLGATNVELVHLPDGFKDVGEMKQKDVDYLRKELDLGTN
jgi:DNA primase